MSEPSEQTTTNSMPSWGEMLEAASGWMQRAHAWAEKNKDALDAFMMWGAVETNCTRAKLYAPIGPTWSAIAAFDRDDATVEELERMVFDLHQPGTEGFDALRKEVLAAPLLADRQREVGELLDSIAEGRNYVAICGTLPLVEGVLALAYGKWQDPSKYPIDDRLFKAHALTSEEEAELVLSHSAIHMVRESIPEVWKSKRMTPGAIAPALNRNIALHGTANGWDTVDNAIRSL
ncbi:hypothetical protein EON81_30360, partial [bacterium]